MEEILKLVLDRNKKRRVLSKSDIKRICEIIIGMNNYLVTPKIAFEHESSVSSDACADTVRKKVTFYTDTLEETLESSYENVKIDGGEVDYKNYIILYYIFHEFIHIKQLDDIARKKHDTATKLFNIDYEISRIKDFYNANYLLFPTEIQAHIMGELNTYKLYSKFPSEFISDEDKNFYAGLVMDKFVRNYIPNIKKNTVTSPSEFLYNNATNYNLSKILNINEEDYKNLLHKEENSSLYKRLMLGLPVDIDEFAYMNLLNDVIHDGQDIDFVKKLKKKTKKTK